MTNPWHPASAPPAPNVPVLVYWPRRGTTCICAAYMRTSSYDPQFGWHLEGSEHDSPSHWMELPAPPGDAKPFTPAAIRALDQIAEAADARNDRQLKGKARP